MIGDTERSAALRLSFVTKNTHKEFHPAAQALERLAGIMESESSSIALTERGDLEPIARHPSFRIFAAMNPATDAGTLARFSHPGAADRASSLIFHSSTPQKLAASA